MKLEIASLVETIKQGKMWPIVWIHGTEKMRIRELTKRIRKLATGKEESTPGSWSETTLEGAKVTGAELLNEASSMSLGGGVRIVWVKEAESVKEPEALLELADAAAEVGAFQTLIVCESSSLDGRKSFTKALLKSKIPVIECADIFPDERGRWIQHLAKRREITLTPSEIAQLDAMEPWSLDRLDSELSKLALWDGASDRHQVFSEDEGTGPQAFEWCDAFWRRDFEGAIREIQVLTREPERALPLLGLLASQLRILRSLQAGSPVQGSPMLLNKMKRNLPEWQEVELAQLEKQLGQIDFDSKQTQKITWAHWSALVQRFCSPPELRTK